MKYIKHILQGLVIGAANVVPGFSGATAALLCGIFEPILLAVKSFDTKALKLLFQGRFQDLSTHIHLSFLLPLFLGLGIGLLGFAKLFEFLFATYPIFVWAFFFGLVAVSIFFVARAVGRFTPSLLGIFLCGAIVAVGLSFLPPAVENASFWYLFLCGVAAICSMILPGLSGSYVLILLGNYQLIIIQGVGQLQLSILLPLAIGCIIGILLFSRLLSWSLKCLPKHSIALLSGFVAGSLRSLWPWKEGIYAGKTITYNYFWPQTGKELALGLIFMLLGGLCILGSEWARNRKL